MENSLTQSSLINILQNDFENIKEIFNLENEDNEDNEDKEYYSNELKIISKYEINYFKNNIDNFIELMSSNDFINIILKLESSHTIKLESNRENLFQIDDPEKKLFYQTVYEAITKYFYMSNYKINLELSNDKLEKQKRETKFYNYKYFIVQAILSVINSKTSKIILGLPSGFTSEDIQKYLSKLLEKELVNLEIKNDYFIIQWTNKEQLFEYITGSEFCNNSFII